MQEPNLKYFLHSGEKEDRQMITFHGQSYSGDIKVMWYSPKMNILLFYSE